MNVEKIQPLTCGHDYCAFACFSRAALQDHVEREHYPEAAANDRAFRERQRLEGMQNVWPDKGSDNG